MNKIKKLLYTREERKADILANFSSELMKEMDKLVEKKGKEEVYKLFNINAGTTYQ